MRKFFKKIIVKYLGGTFLEVINFFKFLFNFIYLFSVLVFIGILGNLFFILKKIKVEEDRLEPLLPLILIFTLILLFILIAFTADYYLKVFKNWILEAKVNEDKILPLSQSRDIILLKLLRELSEEAEEKQKKIDKEDIILDSFPYEIDPSIEDNQMNLVNDLYREMHDIVIKRDTLKDLYSIYQKLN